MNTTTPRNPHGQFESWNTRVDRTRDYMQTQVDQAGQYNGVDAAIGALLLAAGPVIWEMSKERWKQFVLEQRMAPYKAMLKNIRAREAAAASMTDSEKQAKKEEILRILRG